MIEMSYCTAALRDFATGARRRPRTRPTVISGAGDRPRAPPSLKLLWSTSLPPDST